MRGMIFGALIRLFPAAVCAAFAAVLYIAARAARDSRLGHAERVAAQERARAALSAELAGLTAEEATIKDRELTLVNVYEITKKMSGSLTFDDIFGVFSAFVNENLSFSSCDLLIIDHGAGAPRLERRYRVLQGGAKTVSEKAVDYTRLIERFVRDPREVAIARDDDPAAFAELGIAGSAAETFVAVPLLNDKKVAAILAYEGLATADFENASILSMQFGLEIKKVLLYETVERLSVTDSLTGLFVRRYFMERFSEEVERSRSYALTCAFLMIDIDDFKSCNDTYGHLVGDVVLRDVARLMKEHVREIDLVSRYGGEEFAVVLPETTREGALLAAGRIRSCIEGHIFKAYDEKLKLTISTGVALYPQDAATPSGLVECADRALYKAKRSGKNVVSLYSK